MIKSQFNEEEIIEIKNLQLNHPHPFVRKKALVLLLKSQNNSHSKIAQFLDICENTVRSYIKSYNKNKFIALTEVPFNKPKSKLVPFEDIIRDYINQTPPSTIKKACRDIANLTGVSIKESQMRVYLISLGVKFRKVAQIPAKVDIEKQQEFHDEQLMPALERAKKGEKTVYFVDAAHFVLGAFLSYLWSFTRLFIKTPSGRQRFNVLGALNAITKEIITVTNDTYITSTQICELFKKLVKQSSTPITVILDNAKYQKCKLVQNTAIELGIELLFLPPYSPNLNLIERFWKFVKKNTLNNRYYENFTDFRTNIDNLINTAHIKHRDELNSLLSLNFHIYTEEELKKIA